jgi:hypothetical protein
MQGAEKVFVLKGNILNFKFFDVGKVFFRIRSDEVQVNRCFTQLPDFFDIIKNFGVVVAINMKIIDTACIKLADQFFETVLLAGIYGC